MPRKTWAKTEEELKKAEIRKKYREEWKRQREIAKRKAEEGLLREKVGDMADRRKQVKAFKEKYPHPLYGMFELKDYQKEQWIRDHPGVPDSLNRLWKIEYSMLPNRWARQLEHVVVYVGTFPRMEETATGKRRTDRKKVLEITTIHSEDPEFIRNSSLWQALYGSIS